MAKRLLFKVLYDPSKESLVTPNIDVILVHGLDGDPTRTWTHKTSGIIWPQELLPASLPHARVLSFGYNGDTSRNDSIAGIRGNARALVAQLRGRRRNVNPDRPIVFVAHCLGGLIVKQALCFANGEKEYQSIASATHTIMFFGTPHFGSDKKQWELIAKAFSPLDQSMGGGNGKGNVSPLVKAMIRDSDDLQEIEEDFREIAPKYKIISFYETCIWPGKKKCIVSEASARMMIDGEEAVGVDADHVRMCQFEDDEDPAFMDVCQRIQDAVGVDSDTDGGLSDDDIEVSDREGEVAEVIPRSERGESSVRVMMLEYTAPTPAMDDINFLLMRNNNEGSEYRQAGDEVPAYSRIKPAADTAYGGGRSPAGEQSGSFLSRLFGKNISFSSGRA